MEPQEATHYILVVPCDRQTGQVPFQALVSTLSWHATRLQPQGEDAEDCEDPEDCCGCGGCGGADWQAVGHDGGSERCLAELQEALHAALTHQTAASTPCRLVLVYLDCSPASEAEVALLRRLTDRCVVHVFSDGGGGGPSLVGLPHVALHREAGQLPARLVWASARRRPPTALQPALAAAQFSQFCRTDFRLALGDDFEQLLLSPAVAAAGKQLDADLAPWQILDYLEACQPTLPVLAGWSGGGCAADELLAEATAARDRALRLSRGEEVPFAAADRLAAVVQAQAALAHVLAPAQLISAPLVGGGTGSCAGRFAGTLLAAGLDPGEFGHSARPELERAMVRRQARFVAGFRLAVRGDGSWRLDCRRLDEADDCRTLARGLVRLAGGGTLGRLDPDARPWAAGATLSAGEATQLRLRLRLPVGFGDRAADAAVTMDAAEPALGTAGIEVSE